MARVSLQDLWHMRLRCWKSPSSHILSRSCSMSFHLWRTQSSLGYLSSFCIIHEWIDIKGVSILKHPSKSLWIVRPLSQAWLVKHMNLYVMCSKMNRMKLNTCQITKTLLVHKIQIFQVIIFGNEGIDACYKERGCIFYLCVSYSKCWATTTWDHVSIQSLQGCVWKEEC